MTDHFYVNAILAKQLGHLLLVAEHLSTLQTAKKIDVSTLKTDEELDKAKEVDESHQEKVELILDSLSSLVQWVSDPKTIAVTLKKPHVPKDECIEAIDSFLVQPTSAFRIALMTADFLHYMSIVQATWLKYYSTGQYKKTYDANRKLFCSILDVAQISVVHSSTTLNGMIHSMQDCTAISKIHHLLAF